MSQVSKAFTLPAGTTATSRFLVDSSNSDVVTIYSALASAQGYVEITEGQYLGQELIVRVFNRGTYGKVSVYCSRPVWMNNQPYNSVLLSTDPINYESATGKPDGGDLNPYKMTVVLKWVGDGWLVIGGIGVLAPQS